MPNPLTGEKYWYEQDNSLPMSTRENPTPSAALPITNRQLPVNNPVANQNAVPQGSLQGTMTQPQKQGSLLDFQKVMRVVSENVYKYRQKKEGKVLEGQFDPTKVSGSIFSQIMGAVEAKRGGDISKIYGGAVEAAKFDIQQKEEERKAKAAEESKKFELLKQKIDLGIDSVYIPTGTLADKNNNPGNLRFVGQAGATQGEGGFAKFNTPEDGWLALQNQIRLDQSRGLTLAQFVEKYAPSTENDTNLYIQQMSQWLGVDPNVPLASLDYEVVAEQVAKKESGTQMVKAAGTAGQPEIKTWADFKAAEDIKAKEAATSTSKDTAITDFNNKITNIDTALSDTSGLSDAVGTNWFGRTPTPFSGNRQRFISEVEQIVSTDALNALIKAKAQGATFGALSDTEMEILRASATKIGSWAIKDENGKTTGYNVDEDTFKKELETLKQYTQKALSSINTGTIGEIREVNGIKYKKVSGGWETL